MRIAILGAGAIGGLIGAQLAAAGVRVTLIDRGARARALRERGLTILRPDGTRLHLADVAVADADAAVAPHDLVVLAVKAHEIDGALPVLGRLLHGHTAILTVQNGIPWWYFQGLTGELGGRILAAVDPAGRITAALERRRLIGCVAYPAAEVVEPGVVRHVEGTRFPLGELDGSTTPRVQEFAQLMESAGFKAPIVQDIRGEVWLKAWGNLCFNPLSALTRATLAGICRNAETRALAARMMLEAQQIAAALGVEMRVPLERRLQGAERVGEHKTSMLQDLEAGRPLELDALLGAVLELGRLRGITAPTLENIYALTRLLDASNRSTAAAGASGSD